ncbi:immunoglobulin domain-containing protein [Pseudaquabacterium pictum]|nr:immunoglobulin domain-containing protein [Rubrivivax pictus]
MTRRWPTAWLLAAATLLAACGGGNDPATGDAGQAERRSGQALLGTGGGRVLGIDGASVEVPAGALGADATVGIARDDTGAPPLPSRFVPASSTFAVTPHGQNFRQPVTVRIPYDAGALRADQRPAVLKGSPGQRWQLLMDAVVEDGTVAVQVQSLSYFVVVPVPRAGLISGAGTGMPDPAVSTVQVRLDNGWSALPVTGSTARLVQQPAADTPAQLRITAAIGSASDLANLCSGQFVIGNVTRSGVVYRLPGDVAGVNRIATDPASERASRLAAYVPDSATWLIWGDESTPLARDTAYSSLETINAAFSQWDPPDPDFWTGEPTTDLPADALVDAWGTQHRLGLVCIEGWGGWELPIAVQPIMVVRAFPIDSVLITAHPPARMDRLVGQLVTLPSAWVAPEAATAQWQQRLRDSTTWAAVPDVQLLPGTTTVAPGVWQFLDDSLLLYGTARAADDGTSYRLRVCANTLPVRCAYSRESQLRVSSNFPAPVITTQPVGRQYNTGQVVDMTVAYRGLPLPDRVTWQTRLSDTDPWVDVGAGYRNLRPNYPIEGDEASTDRLTGLQPLTTADRGRQFRATYTTVAGTATSDAASIQVTTGQAPPVFTAQPAAATVSAGSAVLFATAVGGAQPMSYQWLFNGVRIPGANGPLLTLHSVNAANAGLYQLEVSNVEATVRSTAARLTVTQGALTGMPPVITGQPVSLTVAAGTSASFAVSAGGGALAYQWQRDGINLPGATAAVLTIPSVADADRGAYAVVVSNASGVASSQVALLNVGPGGTAPVPMAPVITTAPVGVAVLVGQPALLAVAASGSGPLAYRWQRNGVDVAGASAAVLRIDAAQAGDAGDYTVTVSNAAGAATSTAAGLVVTAAPGAPTITLPPQARSAVDGGSATFSASVAGNPAPQCLWLRNGTVIPGATDCSRHTTPPLTLADNGAVYTLFASSAGGHVFAQGAVLTVFTGVPPAITQQPTAQTWRTDAIVFSVGTSGTPAPAIDWAADNERIGTSGRYVLGACSFDFVASGPALTLTGVAEACIGTRFFAIARNDAGRVESTSVAITAPVVVASRLAGLPGSTGSADGPADVARFNTPNYLAVARDGSTAVGDFGNSTVRIVLPGGTVRTLAGSPGVFAHADGTGSAARFAGNGGLAFDSAGNLFVSDWDNHVIRRITPDGVVSTFAGSPGVPGSADGTGAAARLRNPNGLAIDAADNLYVVDWGNHTVRKITPAGEVSTFAGAAGLVGSADGTGAAARFRTPGAVAIDGAGNLYVTDMFNHAVRKITPAGVVSTLAGQPGLAGNVDGTGSAARFDTPAWIAATGDGTLFVVSAAGDTVRRVSAGGVVDTVAGVAGDSSVLRLGANPRLRNARGVWAVSARELLLNADHALIHVQLP